MVNISRFFDMNGPKWAGSLPAYPFQPLNLSYFYDGCYSFADMLLTANNLPLRYHYVVLLRTL